MSLHNNQVLSFDATKVLFIFKREEKKREKLKKKYAERQKNLPTLWLKGFLIPFLQNWRYHNL